MERSVPQGSILAPLLYYLSVKALCAHYALVISSLEFQLLLWGNPITFTSWILNGH